MDTIFKTLQEKENGTFFKKETKWWNGHAYFPCYTYALHYQFLSANIKIHYEYKQSEFSKPSMVDGGAFGDRHHCSIKVNITTNKKNADFQIYERSFFSKLFKKQNTSSYQIKCKDTKLNAFLKNNTNLQNIFSIVENSPEFSPLLQAKSKKQNYSLYITYSTQQENGYALFLANDLCKDIISYIHQ